MGHRLQHRLLGYRLRCILPSFHFFRLFHCLHLRRANDDRDRGKNLPL